jgi:hypothetical protein
MHCEENCLYFFHYQHRGSPKHRVIVASHERKHQKKCLWGYAGALWDAHLEPPRCSLFVRHLGVGVSLGALESRVIDYRLVKQQPGKLMVIAHER